MGFAEHQLGQPVFSLLNALVGHYVPWSMAASCVASA
jgi:hypothetical protein